MTKIFQTNSTFSGLMCVPILLAVMAQPQQKPKPKPKPKPGDITKARGQQVGGPGVFGTTYSISGYVNDWNVSLDGARYQVDADPSSLLFPGPEEKLLITKWSVKNTAAGSQSFWQSGVPATLVDTDGNSTETFLSFYRTGDSKALQMEFKPGQGVTDIVTATKIPSKARIEKIILNTKRAFVPGEQVVRYFISGVSGDAGASPKNAIVPLPKEWADPAVSTGYKPFDVSPMEIGEERAFALFQLSFVKAVYAASFGSAVAAEGNRMLVLTVSLRNATSATLNTGSAGLSGAPALQITDGDGETLDRSTHWSRAVREENLETLNLAPGEKVTVRLAFEVPKRDKPDQSLVLGDEFSSMHPLKINLGGLKD